MRTRSRSPGRTLPIRALLERMVGSGATKHRIESAFCVVDVFSVIDVACLSSNIAGLSDVASELLGGSFTFEEADLI